MKDLKHTPGPWKVKHSESKPAFNVIGTQLGSKYKIARCPYIIFEGPEKLTERDKDEAKANAQLMASAPELIEALRRINHTLTLHGKIDADTDLHEHVLAAISKATTLATPYYG